MLKLINNPPPWPNGARCAVCFSFDFDAESLLHLYYPEDSRRRISLSSTLRYGARVAVPRIVEIWKHFGVKQTMFVPGWCVETYPKAIELLLRDGHEIAHHGWLHERPNQLSRQDEERVLKKGMEIIASVTGKPVAGYRCPSGAYSEYTLDLLIDNGFVYDASLGGDDIPYLIEGSNGRRLVELPSDHSLDDWPQYVNMREFNMGIPDEVARRRPWRFSARISTPPGRMAGFGPRSGTHSSPGGLRGRRPWSAFSSTCAKKAAFGSLRWLRSALIFKGSSTEENGRRRSSGFRSGRSPCHRSCGPAGSSVGGTKLASLATKAGL